MLTAFGCAAGLTRQVAVAVSFYVTVSAAWAGLGNVSTAEVYLGMRSQAFTAGIALWYLKISSKKMTRARACFQTITTREWRRS
ncbi:MAG: hypothetical protein ACYTXE_41030 [Nostoc sp.]